MIWLYNLLSKYFFKENFLLCTNEDTRLKSFDLLLTLVQKRLSSSKYSKLSEYKIPLSSFFNENENNTESTLII